MAKTAKVHQVKVIELSCPYCEEAMEGPSGSQMIEENEWMEMGDTITCVVCGKEVKLPANPFNRKLERK